MVAWVLLRSMLTEINAQPKLFHRNLLQHLTNPPTDFNFDVYVLYQAVRHGWRFHSLEVSFLLGSTARQQCGHLALETPHHGADAGFMFKLGQGLWR